MIILDTTTKSLQFKLAGAITTNQLIFTASYVDTTGTATTPSEQDGTSNNTTAVTIVSAPASATQRLVKSIAIQNADTVAATVTIIYNNNSTLRNVFIATLAVGDQLIYEDGYGWSSLDKNGNIKTSGGSILPVSAGGTGDSGTAWATYTPTVTAGSGSFTTVSATGRYKTLGKTVFFQISINITTNGTAATYVNASLPLQAAAAVYGSTGRESNVTGKQLQCIIGTSASAVSVFTYDNLYPGGSGYLLEMSGVYESV